ncbi:hypothetical protein DCAR_0414984 [Daucus carota subsp. sativus]|uniref:Uncharacterized protein n=1 Tax=Daucus carota subsp. sativus TaxID=79200 RepID=A0AAF1AWF3_DAUCS|nr:hypothetical protein DCAR_0414984 [Daucus carota subsp. sativus]
MGNRGPSPVVPFLMVGVLSLIIFGPTLLYLSEFIIPLFLGDEESGLFSFLMLLLPIVLLAIIHLITLCFPTRRYGAGNVQSLSSGYDSDGFGVGTLLLVVLFFILYNLV